MEGSCEYTGKTDKGCCPNLRIWWGDINSSSSLVCNWQIPITLYMVSTWPLANTDRFIMFSVITNIYNKKTKGPTLMEFFNATGKLKKFFLTIRDVRRVHHGWHGTHRYNIQVLATHTSTCWSVCGKNLNIVSMCAVSPVVHTSNISSCLKKNFLNFLVAVNNSIKVGPLVFLL